MKRPPRILIGGGGFVGLYTALELERRLRPGEAEIIIVSPENFMLYQPLLAEVASGTLGASDVVVPLRVALRRTRLMTGRLVGLEPDDHTALVRTGEGREDRLEWDHLVLGLGAEAKVFPVPGLVEHAVGFGSLGEATALRNHLFDRLEAAESATDPEMRRRALTFVVVGGGYTGVEAIAELEDLARYASRWFPGVRRDEQRWVLVEANDRVLPVVHRSLSDFAAETMRQRGIELQLGTRLESAVDGCIELSNGERFEADTLVWAAGTRPHRLVSDVGLPTDDAGRVVVDACLRVAGTDGLWAAGDAAAVPDLVTGGTCPPTAQYAERQARHLARNLTAAVRGQNPTPFRHRSRGELVTLGRYKGVGNLLGRRVRGFGPWFLRRTYYVSRIPTVERKARLVTRWTLSLLFPRDPVNLAAAGRPGDALRRAAALDRSGRVR